MASIRSFSAGLTIYLATVWSSAAAFAQEASSTTAAAISQPTICGDIITYANEDINQNWLFDALSVYECLISVPFLDAVALRYIDYYNQTLQYQSTLNYLYSPPSGYQQPGIDVEKVLSEIKQNITAGFYQNEYDFEATLYSLIQRMHDSHVNLDAGALSAFTFGSPYDLMSLSPDGVQPPKIYFKDDVVAAASGGPVPVSISTINGEDAVQYLEDFAAYQSFGFVDADADWNSLFYNPVQDVQGTFNLFGWEAIFYPGADTDGNLTFVYENGTEIDTIWYALYQNYDQTGPLTTGGDFYNYFVLGLLPASYNVTFTNNTSSDTGDGNSTVANATSWYSVSPAFPQNADVYQPDLTVGGFGIVTGYFLTNISTAVLSVPSFDEVLEGNSEFSDTVAQFISQAKAAGMTKVVIDLSENYGGEIILAYDIFRQFFPNIEPFAGSRMRSFEQENILGDSITNFFDDLYPGNPDYNYSYYYGPLASSEWVVTDRINAATGQNFSSWPQFYGPVVEQGDTFSLTEQYNYTSEVFLSSAAGGFVPQRRPDTVPPWQPEDIILLTDGTCASTCTLFVEAMTHDAGVRTVVVGGRPKAGPMQAASGSRGARAYYADDLDSDMEFAMAVNETANTTLPQDREQAIYTFYMGFNLRDQLRKNEPVPLQFQYIAADCRIYYTLANAYNMERLWRDAAAAAWTNPSLCVAGSTGYSTSGNTTAQNSPPSTTKTNPPFWGFQTPPDAQYNNTGAGLVDPAKPKTNALFGPCDNTCTSGRCAPLDCDDGTIKEVCATICTTQGQCGQGHGVCTDLVKQPEAKVRGKVSVSAGGSGYVGTCAPNPNQFSCPFSGGPTVPNN